MHFHHYGIKYGMKIDIYRKENSFELNVKIIFSVAMGHDICNFKMNIQISFFWSPQISEKEHIVHVVVQDSD